MHATPGYSLQSAEMGLALAGLAISAAIMVMCLDLLSGGRIASAAQALAAGLRQAGPRLAAVKDDQADSAA